MKCLILIFLFAGSWAHVLRLVLLLGCVPFAAKSETLAESGSKSTPRVYTLEDLRSDPVTKECVTPKPKPAPEPNCSPQAPRNFDFFKPVASEDLPTTLMEGNLENLKTALQTQLKACAKVRDGSLTLGGKSFSRKNLCTKSNQALLNIANTSGIDFAGFLSRAKKELDWYQYRCADQSGNVGFTGYYSPVIKVKARKPGQDCSFPVYRRPPDLIETNVKTVECKGLPTERTKTTEKTLRRLPDGSTAPYFTREEIISKHALKGKNLEIVCLDNAWAVHDLQIQGSGIVEEIDDQGQTVKKHYLNFDARNGHPWMGVGSVLKCLKTAGRIDIKDLTMKGTGEWLAQHPEWAEAVMNADASYVFFTDKAQAPLGADNIDLTPGHSLAVDRDMIPIGTPILFSTPLPGKGPTQSLALAQDVGGAIKGCRIDIYFGEGETAGRRGGSMKANGPVFIAIPKD